MPRGLVVRVLLLFCALSFGLAAASGPASADSDYHDSVAGTGSARPPAPRLALQNSDFELVAVAQGQQLLIYLDRFDDGAPIDGAEIDVGTGEKTLRATPLDRGVYVVAADWAAAPGQHELIFTMNTGQVSATLAGTLAVPARAEPGEAAHDEETSSSSSPLTVSLPIEAVLSIALGVLAVTCLSALAVFRGKGVVAAFATVGASLKDAGRLAGVMHPLRLAAARPGRSIAATFAALLLISLLLLGRSVLAGKDDAQHAMGGAVGTVR
jgi:cobalt-zinc-cadmium efflux system membrane fusion protein